MFRRDVRHKFCLNIEHLLERYFIKKCNNTPEKVKHRDLIQHNLESVGGKLAFFIGGAPRTILFNFDFCKDRLHYTTGVLQARHNC